MLKGQSIKNLVANYLTLSSSICTSIAAFGIANLLSSEADPLKIIVVWISVQLISRLGWIAIKGHFAIPTGYKHLQWTDLATEYARRLKIQPKDVYVIEGNEESFLARAMPDRIIVRWEAASQTPERSMEFIIAHEMAHYYPSEYRWAFAVISTSLSLFGLAFCVLVYWWVIPLILTCCVGIRAGLVTYEYRQREYRTDLLAMQITSPSLALDTYRPHPESGFLRFFKKGPSYNARRNFLLRHIDDHSKLNAESSQRQSDSSEATLPSYDWNKLLK